MSAPAHEQPQPPKESTTTMRTLVGVDAHDFYVSALSLVGRLDFAGNHVTLAHVEPRVSPQFAVAPVVYDYLSAAELEDRLRLRSKAVLYGAEIKAGQAGLPSIERVSTFGSSSATIMRLADEGRADLIAIGSEGRGPVESAFLGSVGRALAIGSECSFLVGRGRTGQGPVKAVFANDGSDYAVRCFRRLMNMAPKGIGELTIVTATDPVFERKVASEMGIEAPDPYVLSQAETRIREANEGLASRWRERGGTANVRLIEGHPADAIRQALEESGAELLILGARGHGLLKRVLIGSLALHMVVAEPYSVLVLRIPGDA